MINHIEKYFVKQLIEGIETIIDGSTGLIKVISFKPLLINKIGEMEDNFNIEAEFKKAKIKVNSAIKEYLGNEKNESLDLKNWLKEKFKYC